MTNYFKPIILIGAIVVCSTLNGCTKQEQNASNHNTDFTASETETNTEQSGVDLTETKKDPDTVTEQSSPMLIGAGNYTCKLDNNTLTIIFAATDNQDKNRYYDEYHWVCTVPPEYPDNKYSSVLVSFYDENTGVVLASLGSGAGSTYYNFYMTFDGGKTWMKQDQEFKKSNTKEALFFTDDHTFVLLDLGIGLSSPSINVFNLSDQTITTIADHKWLNEIDDMLKTFQVTEIIDATHFNCEYTYEGDSTARKCTINLDDYTN